MPVNTIIGTDPTAGTPVGRGFAVKLIVSSGPRPVQVPNVLNLAVDTALSQLQTAGFVVSETQAPSDTVAAGNMISTNPGPNTQAPKGSKVTIVISTGPQMITVDDVTGETDVAAKADLEGQGFVGRDRAHVVDARRTSARSSARTRSGGTQQKSGTTIVLTVGESSTTTTGGEPHHRPDVAMSRAVARATGTRRTVVTTCRGTRRATAGRCSSPR